MKLGDLIREYRESHDLSQRQFADICGLSNGYISMLERGVNPNTQKPITPTIPQLKKIADGLGMTIAEMIDKVDDMPVELSGISATNIIPFPEMHKVPLIGAIACGAPILAEEHIEDYVDIPRHITADFALVCKGDSMINARIFDGDIVYIRQQETVDNGQIAAVLIDGEATLKRVKIYDDHIVLEPENPHYRPFTFWSEEMNDIRILGKAVAFTSAVR